MAIPVEGGVDQLLEMNKAIKRRIFREFDSKGKPYSVDSLGKRIKTISAGMPTVITADMTENLRDLPEHMKGRPYIFSPDGQGYALAKREANLVLGIDYARDPEDIHAMLKAGVGGPGWTNAYVLGGTHHGIHGDPDCAVIAVQYYQLSPKMHEKLALENHPKLLKELGG